MKNPPLTRDSVKMGHCAIASHMARVKNEKEKSRILKKLIFKIVYAFLDRSII